MRPAGHHRPRQGAVGHEEPGGLLGGARSGAGRAADAEAGRLRLQARRLYLTEPLPRRREARGRAFVPAGMDGETHMFRLARLTPAQFDGLPVIATAAWVV